MINHKKLREKEQREQELMQERDVLARNSLMAEEMQRQQFEQRNQLRQTFRQQYNDKEDQKRREKEQEEAEKGKYRMQADMARDVGALKEMNYREYYRQFEQQQRQLWDKRPEDPRESVKQKHIRQQETYDDLLLKNHEEVESKRRQDQHDMRYVL